MINFTFPLPPHQKYNITHTVWRTWLFIAYSGERRPYNQWFSLHPLHIFSLRGWENVLFELRSERVYARASSRVEANLATLPLWLLRNCWPNHSHRLSQNLNTKRMRVCDQTRMTLVRSRRRLIAAKQRCSSTKNVVACGKSYLALFWLLLVVSGDSGSGGGFSCGGRGDYNSRRTASWLSDWCWQWLGWFFL